MLQLRPHPKIDVGSRLAPSLLGTSYGTASTYEQLASPAGIAATAAKLRDLLEARNIIYNLVWTSCIVFVSVYQRGRTTRPTTRGSPAGIAATDAKLRALLEARIEYIVDLVVSRCSGIGLPSGIVLETLFWLAADLRRHPTLASLGLAELFPLYCLT